ncbi:hypothetical protein [Halonotius roseus]|uniref:Uncharacterized protein n=1 Tax=Halonotius roseus TaxID=2511997 RepID=A0A544QLV5_9EURY|nr:hypothetical protein [Halonotius roseus]TQQ79552.1 hypothetical protein EWF95_11105 [Halonotius roseus]
MNRRRALIYIGTLAFGASGFVASGAFSTGSQGSLGDNWIQVAGTDQAVSFESPQQVDGGDGSSGDGADGGAGTGEDGTNGDDGTDDGTNDGGEQTDDGTNDGTEGETDEQPQDETDDGTGGDGGDDGVDDGGDDGGETVTTRVQVVTEPNNPGNAVNGTGSASWSGQIVASEVVRGTSDGFFRGVRARDVNQNATSTIGRLDNGYPNGEAAFIIANVGPAESGNPTGSVSLTATLFADGAVLETDQLRFPYRVVDTGGTTVARGENLFSAGGVTLADGHVIEVVIVVDTTDGDDDLERLDTLQFTATGVGS